MEWVSALKTFTPRPTSSEYAFGGSSEPREEQRVKAAEAWHKLGLEAAGIAKRSSEDALSLVQTLPGLAIVWLDVVTSQLTKDVYSRNWNEIAGETCVTFVSLCRIPWLRDVLACDRPLLSSFVSVFLVSANPDVLSECLRLFSSCLLTVAEADDPTTIAAYSVVCCGDVVKKAVFVAENAMDAALVNTCIGFLINVVCGAPGMFATDLETCVSAKRESAAQAKAALDLAVALGASNTTVQSSNNPTNVTECLYATVLGCVCTIVSVSGAIGTPSTQVQLLCRLCDGVLRLLGHATALSVLLCKCDVMNATLLDPACTETGVANVRLVDVMAQLIGAANTPDSAVTALLCVHPFTVDTKVCAALVGHVGVLSGIVLSMEPFAFLHRWSEYNSVDTITAIAKDTAQHSEDEIVEAGIVLEVFQRLCACADGVVKRWNPTTTPKPPPAVQNIVSSFKASLERLDVLLRACRHWLMLSRGAAPLVAVSTTSGDGMDDDELSSTLSEGVRALQTTSNHATHAIQTLCACVKSLRERLPTDASLQASHARLCFVCGVDDAVTVTEPPVPMQTVTEPIVTREETSQATATTAPVKKRSRFHD